MICCVEGDVRPGRSEGERLVVGVGVDSAVPTRRGEGLNGDADDVLGALYGQEDAAVCVWKRIWSRADY